MRLLFTSDLHLTRGRRRRLLREVADPWHEVWVDTGDLFPNTTLLRNLDWVTAQREHQVRWLRNTGLAPRLAAALAGRPAVLVPGNHDFISLKPALAHAGARVFDGTQVFELEGERFAGFREVPLHRGVWVGEVADEELERVVGVVMGRDPTILVSHSPSRGVLDDARHVLHVGIEALRVALEETDHRVRWHLHGHIHESGGKWENRGSTRHVNGARFFMRVDTTLGTVEVLPEVR